MTIKTAGCHKGEAVAIVLQHGGTYSTETEVPDETDGSSRQI